MTTKPPHRGRRSNGEGSTYRRGDGTWVAALTLPDGKRRVLYGKTQAEARDKLLSARADVVAGLPLPKARLTLGAWLEEWLDVIAPNGIRPSTLVVYSSYIRNHVIPHRVAHIGLVRLGPSDLDRLFTDLRDDGLAPGTVVLIRTIVRRALAVGQKRGHVARNVASLTDSPRVERREPQALTPQAARRVLDALAGERHFSLYATALATGLRLGELLGLRWEDIDLDARTLRVHQPLLVSTAKRP